MKKSTIVFSKLFNKHILITILLSITTLSINAQSWIFNTSTLNGWSTVRINAVPMVAQVNLTTTGQNNPKFENSNANIDANNNQYAIVKMRVGVGGPTLLRINFPNGNKTTPINTGTTNFVTYAIDMSHNSWNGTINNIELAFKDNDGTSGGGTHSSNNITIEIKEIAFVSFVPSSQTVLYVDPNNGNDASVGSFSEPLKSIPYALDLAAFNTISNVFIKSGSYSFSNGIDITTQATAKITLSPEPNGSVKFNFSSFRNFRFYQGAQNIEISGFELDGNSNTLDHWTLLSEYVWLPHLLPDSLSGGGICFQIEDAEDIIISNNVIHDFYQKAINIEDGRYVSIKGNIIYNIAQTSLSGGHGIMRQQGSGSFTAADDATKFRWDIDGNLIYNVYQKIYSWVPSKGYLNMTLDEGKPILIDETPNHDIGMKARIKNNVVAFSMIDAIRLKPTNGLEVLNNTIYAQHYHSDGITNTTNGFNSSVFGDPFSNFRCENNAVEVNSVADAFKLDDALNSAGSFASNNFAAFGSSQPSAISTNQNTNLLIDPKNGNFKLINSSLVNVGVDTTVLGDLIARSNAFGISIISDEWEDDHLKNTQTLLDNIPGIEDGIPQNEEVFTDAGTYDLSDLEYNKGRKAYYFSINPSWQANNISNNNVLSHGNGLDAYNGKYEIIVPEDYSTWLDSINVNYLRDSDGDGIGDTPYNRIRYGSSVIAQNKVYPEHTLQYVELNSDSNFTVTSSNNNHIIFNGLDFLIRCNYSFSGIRTYDLVTADSISGTVDTVILEGYTGDYNIGIFNVNQKYVVRLVLGSVNFIGTNYYVSNGGNDSNDGLTANSPFGTINYALSKLSPADTLNFLFGTYSHPSFGDGNWFKNQNETSIFINNLNGFPGAYITIRADQNNFAKIKGDGIAAIEIKNSSFIRLEGFEVEGNVDLIPLDTATKYQFLYRDPSGTNQYRFPPGTSESIVSSTTNLPVLNTSYKRPTYFNTSGISVKNSNHIEILNNYVHHMPGEGIKSFDSDYLLISGNTVHDCSRRSSHGVHGLSIYTLNSIDNNNDYKVIIEKNKVYDNYNEVYSWNQTKTFVNPHFDEGKGITIQRCSPSTGWNFGKILIKNNLSYRNGLSGIQINVGERIDIFHNTIYGNHRTTEMFNDGSQHGISVQGGNDINIKNNIAQSWSPIQESKVYKISSNSTNISTSNNLFSGGQDGSLNVIHSSPQFIDSSNFNFSLKSTSPAINAGLSTIVNKDIIDNNRDSNPDIGAYEWNLSCNTTFATDVISACQSYTWIDGITYTNSNNSATVTLINQNGCDSIVTLDLTINNPSFSNTAITACDSYSWNGTNYSSSGTYTWTTTNAQGCDSIATLNLTINNTTFATDVISACQSYTWIDGITYTNSNNSATVTLINQNGCDSIVTLDLTISSIDNSIILNGTTINAISGYDSYQWYNCNSSGSTPIPNEIYDSIIVDNNGEYQVEITYNNCTSFSDCVNINFNSTNEYDLKRLKVFPNPTDGFITIITPEFYNPNSKCTYSIINLTGKYMISNEQIEQSKSTFDLSNLPNGAYFIKIEANNNLYQKKIIIQK